MCQWAPGFLMCVQFPPNERIAHGENGDGSCHPALQRWCVKTGSHPVRSSPSSSSERSVVAYLYFQKAAVGTMEQRVATRVRRGQLGVVRDALEHGGAEDVGATPDLEEQPVVCPEQVGCGDQRDVELGRLTRDERDRHGVVVRDLIVACPRGIDPTVSGLEPAP